jgi:subtilase family serine protease
MKRVQLFMMLLLTANIAMAQVKTLKPGTARSNKQVTPKERSVVQSPANESLPDLRIVTLIVTYTGDQTAGSEVRRKLEISYTVKNEGTVAVNPAAFGVQGFLSNGTPGCGGGVNLPAGSLIEPGATASGSFTCSAKFDKTGSPTYTLQVDYGNRIKESNEQNNSAQQTILF